MEHKSRNEKINITDIAVNKVKIVPVTGFSDVQNKLLQQYHKDILKISKEKNDSNEVLRIWNTYTGEYTDTFGDEKHVDPWGNPDSSYKTFF